MARPRLGESERRRRTIGVRVTEAEEAALRERAQAARLSMGAYLRRRALAEARLAALRSPTGDRTAGGSGSPTARAQPTADRDAPLRAGETRVFDGIEFVWVPKGGVPDGLDEFGGVV